MTPLPSKSTSLEPRLPSFHPAPLRRQRTRRGGKELKFAVTLFITLLLSSPFLQAQNRTPPPLGAVPAEWPGVTFEIAKIHRLDPTHILVAVRVRGESTLKAPVLIGTTKITELKSESAPPEQLVEFIPFSLSSAKLVDQATGMEYPADDKLPAAPYWGGPEISTDVRKNTWFQLAVGFKCPPPLPPTPDGKIQVQKVAFRLPMAKADVKDIVLPPLEILN